MRKVCAALLCAVSMLAACAPEVDQTITHSQLCVLSSGGLCRVPYSVIFSDRSELLGRNIGTRGHLIKDGNDFALYESHVSAALGGREAAVLIISGNFEEGAEQLVGRDVVVVGDFGLNEAGWWGEIALTKSPGEIAILE